MTSLGLKKVLTSEDTMVSPASLTILAFVVLGSFTNPSESGFALKRVDERKLLRCLMSRSRKSEQHCFRKSTLKLSTHCRTNIPGSSLETKYNRDLDPAIEYLCALNGYLNSERTTEDAIRAVLASGSCSRDFRSVASTWDAFLKERGNEIRIKAPFRQHVNGSRIIVRFTRGHHTINYITESLKAVDIVIARSLDDEIYGKYIIRASMQKKDGENIVTHESLQATCPFHGKRFFVIGLNNKGCAAVQNWLEEGGNPMEFSVDVVAQRRITQDFLTHERASTGRPNLGLKISALVLHFAESSFYGTPLSDGILFPTQAPRKRRSAMDCHREAYVTNYRQNNRVIRPVEFDIGGCVGSCDRAQVPSFSFKFNETNRARSLIQGELKTTTPDNARPTACCVPISSRGLHFVIQGDESLPMGNYIKSMVTKHCGCR